MNIKKLKFLCLAGLLASSPLLAEPVLFEDFSGETVSLTKYWGMEKSIQLDSASQNVVMSANGKAFTRTGRGNNLTLIDSTTSLLQADITLTELSTGNSASQNAMLGISGTYYNARSASPTDDIGDVFVRLTLGDRGNGPEAWYELQESTDPLFNDSTIVTGSFGPISLNTSYPMSIAYDGDNTFTLIFNNGESVSIDGPARMGEANSPFRSINQRLRFGRDNSMPDAWEVASENGTTASITGTVDNVTTDAGLLDDFSSSNLDQGIWRQDQNSVAVTDGKLEMRVTGQGDQRTERLFLKQKGLNTFGADVTLLSDSTINDTTRVRGRITHYLSNDTYDFENGETGNGLEGMIWTQFLIERSNGNNRAAVYAARVTDPDFNTQTDLFFETVGPINLDQEYSLLIEKTGTLVEYKLDGAVVYSFDLATDFNTILSGNDFAPVGDTESSVQARILNDAGEVHVRFDDVVTDHTPQPLTLNAFDQNDSQSAYPAGVVAHEGEVIDLVASVANPADIAIFQWEQTTGPDVTIVAGRLAGKIVGSEQTLSFTVPDGADSQTLAFKVTIVDNAGFDTTQAFNVAVDNSASSTLTGDAPVDSNTSSGGSSGSGAFNLPFLLLLTIAMFAGFASRRGE